MTTKLDAVSGRRFFPAVPVLGILGMALGASHCASEPQDVCAVPTGEAIALYTPMGMMSPQCMMAMNLVSPALAGTTPKGEAFGMEWYVGDNPNNADAATTPGSFAIKAEAIGTRIQDARDNAGLATYPYANAMSVVPPPPENTSPNHVFAWGRFDNMYADANNICTVSHMIGSNVMYPDVPMHMAPDGMGGMMAVMDQPATQIDYEWSNVKVYVKAPIIGSRIDANLTITEDGCSQSYQVNILFPRVTCASAANPDVGDPTACSANPTPVANPSQSQLYGSGIAPGIDVTCQDIGVNMPGAHDWECLPAHPL